MKDFPPISSPTNQTDFQLETTFPDHLEEDKKMVGQRPAVPKEKTLGAKQYIAVWFVDMCEGVLYVIIQKK